MNSNKKNINNSQKIPNKNFVLYKQIIGKNQNHIKGENELHKLSVLNSNEKSRKFLIKNIKSTGPIDIYPGQLIIFNYYNPQNKEDLKYYDAKPCTIFFGNINTDEGKRVIGFNIHYYPPKIRYIILNKIFELYKNIYLKNWNESLDKDIADFNYKTLIRKLQEQGLDFGVRMYIPKLMGDIKPIPPKYWAKAVYTEGLFKKSTRENIMNYWRMRLKNLKQTPGQHKNN